MPRKPYDYHYIYKTTNLINGKFYIGMHSTFNIEDGYLGSGKILSYSIKKYGKENFKIEIIEFLANRDLLKEREHELVNESLIKDPQCMNIRLGGGGMQKGSEISDETKLKISLNSKSGTDEVRKKISEGNMGKSKPCSDSRREKMRVVMKGKIQSDEHNLNKSIGIKKTWVKRKESSLNIIRKPHSEETKQKIKQSNINNDRNMSGENNPRAKTYKFINPNGVEFIIKGGKKQFCIDNNINIKKVIHLSEHNGWKFIEL